MSINDVLVSTDNMLEHLKKSAQSIKEYEQRQKELPRLNFIESAKKAGFTESQADFMYAWMQGIRTSIGFWGR